MEKAVKIEADEKSAMPVYDAPVKIRVDLTVDTPLDAEPMSAERQIILRSLGVTSIMEDFFSSAVTVTDTRSWE